MKFAGKHSACSGRRGFYFGKKQRRPAMTDTRLFKAVGVLTAFVAIVVAGMVNSSRHVRAHDDDNDERDESRIHRGFEISPVPLDLVGKNRELVGLGSYIVNAVGDCNGCHTTSNATQYAPGGNPYFKGNQPAVLNQNTYLAGGNLFVLIPGITPDIFTRNLTPDRTGRAAGGRTFEEFRLIMRTGV